MPRMVLTWQQLLKTLVFRWRSISILRRADPSGPTDTHRQHGTTSGLWVAADRPIDDETEAVERSFARLCEAVPEQPAVTTSRPPWPATPQPGQQALTGQVVP